MHEIAAGMFVGACWFRYGMELGMGLPRHRGGGGGGEGPFLSRATA